MILLHRWEWLYEWMAKDCIRDMGYTKVSFAEKADISRPSLDKLLNGSIYRQ